MSSQGGRGGRGRGERGRGERGQGDSRGRGRDHGFGDQEGGRGRALGGEPGGFTGGFAGGARGGFRGGRGGGAMGGRGGAAVQVYLLAFSAHTHAAAVQLTTTGLGLQTEHRFLIRVS